MLTIRTPANTLQGRARVMQDLGAIERHGHRKVIECLEELLDEVALTPEQAREVFDELAARRMLLQEVERQNKAAYNAAWVHQHKARGAEARRS